LAEAEKYTFTAVMTFLVKLEERLAEFYSRLASEVDSQELAELLSNFAEKNREWRDTLDRVRRETVLEMTLEPIMGLQLKRFEDEINSIIDSSLGPVEKAVQLEQKLQELYKKASAKVLHSSADASIVLDRLVRECRKRREKLSKFM